MFYIHIFYMFYIYYILYVLYLTVFYILCPYSFYCTQFLTHTYLTISHRECTDSAARHKLFELMITFRVFAARFARWRFLAVIDTFLLKRSIIRARLSYCAFVHVSRLFLCKEYRIVSRLKLVI